MCSSTCVCCVTRLLCAGLVWHGENAPPLVWRKHALTSSILKRLCSQTDTCCGAP